MAPLTSFMEVTPIQRTCLVLNGKLHRLHGDDRDPGPCVRVYVEGTAAQYLLTELCPHNEDRAFGLVDDGGGTPRLDWISLSEIAAAGGQVDPLWKAGYRLSHYVAVAEMAGRIIAYETPSRARF